MLLNVGLGHNGREGNAQVVQDGNIRLNRVDNNGIVTGDLHALDKADHIVDIGGSNSPIQGVLHILKCHLGAVVELDPLPDGELPAGVVQLLVAFGQAGLRITVAGHPHQGTENLRVDRNCTRLLAHVGVQGGNVSGLSPSQRILIRSRAAVPTAGLGVLASATGGQQHEARQCQRK